MRHRRRRDPAASPNEGNHCRAPRHDFGRDTSNGRCGPAQSAARSLSTPRACTAHTNPPPVFISNLPRQRDDEITRPKTFAQDQQISGPGIGCCRVVMRDSHYACASAWTRMAGGRRRPVHRSSSLSARWLCLLLMGQQFWIETDEINVAARARPPRRCPLRR